MTTYTSITAAPTQFTFRKSWLDAINRIHAKSTRSRLIQAIITYAFTHEFTLTGNSTIDSLMTLIADQIDTQLGRQNNFKQPEPKAPKPSNLLSSQTIQTSPNRSIPTATPTPAQADPKGLNAPTAPKTSIVPKLPPFPIHRAPKGKAFQRLPISKFLQTPNRPRRVFHKRFR